VAAIEVAEVAAAEAEAAAEVVVTEAGAEAEAAAEVAVTEMEAEAVAAAEVAVTEVVVTAVAAGVQNDQWAAVLAAPEAEVTEVAVMVATTIQAAGEIMTRKSQRLNPPRTAPSKSRRSRKTCSGTCTSTRNTSEALISLELIP
jgi:hypothetical protein